MASKDSYQRWLDELEAKKLFERTDEEVQRFFSRMSRCAAFLDVGLAIPVIQGVPALPFSTTVRLVNDTGVQALAVEGVDEAAVREQLLAVFRDQGYSRVLMLSPDVVLGSDGLAQMLATMEATEASAVSAVVPISRDANKEMTYNALVGDEPLRKGDLPQTGVPFPVPDGITDLSCVLLNVRDITRFSAPWFSSQTQGASRITPAAAFSKWLNMHDLDIYLDPKVKVLRVVEELYGYSYTPPE